MKSKHLDVIGLVRCQACWEDQGSLSMLPVQGPAAQVPPRGGLWGKEADSWHPPTPSILTLLSPQEQTVEIHSGSSPIDNRLQEYTALVAGRLSLVNTMA